MAVVTDSLVTVFKTLGLEEYRRAFDQAAEANRKVGREERRRADDGKDNPITGRPAALAALATRATTAAAGLFVLREAFETLRGVMVALNEPFIRQEQSIFRMNLVLRNLGRSVEIPGLVRFNQEMAAMSGATSGSLAELTALLVQFNLTDEEIRRSTPVILDWSRAVGIEATRAADILGSALRNEKDAIQRYGVDIDLTRSRSEKLNQALTQLEARFRGGAQAASGTLGGSLERLRNQFDELRASISRLFEPISTTLVQGLRNILAFYTGLFQVIGAGLEKIGLLRPVGAAAGQVGTGATAAAIGNGATETTQQEIARNTKKTADSLGSFGRFIVGGGAAASGALNIRGLNAALRAGR